MEDKIPGPVGKVLQFLVDFGQSVGDEVVETFSDCAASIGNSVDNFKSFIDTIASESIKCTDKFMEDATKAICCVANTAKFVSNLSVWSAIKNIMMVASGSILKAFIHGVTPTLAEFELRHKYQNISKKVLGLTQISKAVGESINNSLEWITLLLNLCYFPMVTPLFIIIYRSYLYFRNESMADNLISGNSNNYRLRDAKVTIIAISIHIVITLFVLCMEFLSFLLATVMKDSLLFDITVTGEFEYIAPKIKDDASFVEKLLEGFHFSDQYTFIYQAFKCRHEIQEPSIMKWQWIAFLVVGYILVVIPFFTYRFSNELKTRIMGYYIKESETRRNSE